jgi:hypothetical protein
MTPGTLSQRRSRRAAVAALLLAVAGALGGCVVYPSPYGEPVPAASSRYDQAWDAALGAAADAGIQVGGADRASGRISGSKAGAPVSIAVQQLADGRIQVSFDAPASRETNPTLQQRWLDAYNRRMGR